MRKTRLQKILDNARVEDALARAKTPSLANPALGTHAIVMFAIDHVEIFREWLNEGAGDEENDPPKTVEDVTVFLTALHKAIDMALIGSEFEVPAGTTNVHILRVPRHTQPL